MNKFCVKCGRALEGAEKFCGGCGAPVEVAAPVEIAAPVENADPSWGGKLFDLDVDQQEMPRKAPKKKAVLPVILCVILAVVTVLVLLLLRSCDEEESGKSRKRKTSTQLSTQPAASTEPTVIEPVPTEPVQTEPEPTEPAPADFMTHAQYMAADYDEAVTVECYVQATQSWWDNKITVYAQDRDGAYFIYDMKCSQEDAAKLTAGTKIRVSGFKGLWAGEIEILDGTFEFVDDGDTFVAKPLDVTNLLGTEELIDHQNEKVAFKGVTIDSIQYKNDEPGDDIYVNINWGNATYEFCVERYLTDPETEVYKAFAGLKPGDVVDLEGFLYWYEGVNTHITAVAKSASTEDLLASNQKKINVFLSNFAEQGFQGHPATAFDILEFALIYSQLYLDEKVQIDAQTGAYSIAKKDIETVMNDFFGMTVEPWQCEVVSGADYVDRGVIYVDGRYKYFSGEGEMITRFAVARSMKENYNDTYVVDFDIYEVKSGEVKNSHYSLTAEEAAGSGAIRRVTGGSATVREHTRSTGKESYQLVDYALDYEG